MGSIKAKYSSVELFFDKCSTEYPIVLNIANEILRQVEQMLYEAERDKQKLRSQIIKLKAMQDGLSSKSMRCSAMISEAQSECQRYSREMEYIQSHPIPTTKTDSDGNEYTEMVVDEAAYRAASRNQMEASSTLSLQMSKQYDIEEVGDRIKDKIEDFEWTYKGIELIIKNLETCVYEIKKTISAMEYEADYNNTKFREVLEALSAYLASKPIFMPSNAVYSQECEANITSGSVSIGDGRSVDVEQSNGSEPQVYQQSEHRSFLETRTLQIEGVIGDFLNGGGKTISYDYATAVLSSLHNYSGDGFREIRSAYNNPKAPASWADELNRVDDYINNAPKWNGRIYRGINVPSVVARTMIEDGTVDMLGPSSWSSDENVARRFSWGGEAVNIVFSLNNKSGASITHISTYDGFESEILAPSKIQYKIDSTEERVIDGETYLYIEIHEES